VADPVIPDEGLKEILEGIRAGSFSLAVVLIKADFTPSQSTVWSGLTEANYTGYSRQAPVWGAASINGSGNGETDAATLTFTKGAGGTTNTIYAAALVNVRGGTTRLVCVQKLDTAKAMTNAGDAVLVTPSWLDQQEALT